ncbi:MAG: MFS transporter [Eubacteriales bacterium]
MKTYLRQIMNLPRAVKLLILTEIFLSVASGIISIELNFLLREKGFASDKIGQIVSFGTLVSAAFAFFAGYISSRFGYKFSMVIGCILKSVSIFILVYSSSYEMLVSARMMNGIGECMIYVCLFPYIMSFVDGPLKIMAFTLLFSLQTLAAFVGYLAAGLLPNIMPSYRRIVLVSAFTVALVAGMRFFLPKPMHEQKAPAKVHRTTYRYLRQKYVIAYFLYVFVGYAAFMLSYSMINLICRDYFSMPDNKIAYIIGMISLFTGVLLFLTPVVVEKLNRFRLNFISMILLAFLYPAIGFLPRVFYVVLVVIVSITFFIMAGFIDGPMLEMISDEEKGSFSGCKLLMNYLGISAGTLTAGWILNSYSRYSLIYYISGALVVMQIIIYLSGMRRQLEKGVESM